ncbi:MAG: tRNA 2-selenouridine(34) synthase MnmH, partial [Deltaproteobacteria bacterium]|nr:tRNA 2-selenouridine(34) synthase MnmH [Deltaproteobacteria bacterium]
MTIFEALTLSNVLFIDVRTPLEFLDGAIPCAVNIPLLSNEERVEIGTLYKQRGAFVARERGLELVSPKFPSLYQEVKAIVQGRKPIIYCWRGGLRSLTVATILELVGLEVFVIEGGYKRYRNEVLRVLNTPTPFELITLYGLTGSGKTRLLQKMKKEGLPVIDLEALACHRGSLLGQVGIHTRQNQKNFEALLYEKKKK